MSPATELSRAYDIAAAAAHDMNSELVIIKTVVALLISDTAVDDPLRYAMLAGHKASDRCIWITTGLLNFAAKHGGRASNCTMERLIEMAEDPKG